MTRLCLRCARYGLPVAFVLNLLHPLIHGLEGGMLDTLIPALAALPSQKDQPYG